jgi:class 3 adenylate cyclase
VKYSTKLYLGFVSISAINIFLAVGIDQYKMRQFTFYELQSKGLSIAATVASQIDGDAVKQIKTQEDQKKPVYTQLQQVLRKARDANRRSDVYIKFLYTIYPDPKDPERFLFGVDPEEEEKDFSPAGSDSPGVVEEELYKHQTEVYSAGKLIKDPWGTWLTGYAPIYDKEGAYVGNVGVDISATLVAQKLNSLLLFAGLSLVISLLLSFILAKWLANRVTRSLRTLEKATSEIGKGDFTYRIQLTTGDEFEELARSMNQMNEGLEEKERLKSGFAHYVSQHVLEKIVKSKGSAKLEGERKKITVFFSDIRNFTHLSESMPPEKVMAFLNDYFEKMLGIIFKHNGMLDKLLGDGIMAEFGVPVEDLQQERNAVLTALEMIEAMELLQEKWKKEGKPPIDIGIGIHTGDAIVGSLGSEERMQYTAIGDTVNIAERLQEVSRDQKYPIIVSETTFNALYNEFPSKNLGPLTLHGKENQINAYAIFPKSPKSEEPEQPGTPPVI